LFFEQESIAFQILDVLELNQGNVKIYNSKRNFEALSFRYESDTIIETKDKQIELKDNSVALFPSATDYTRISKKDKLIVIHFKSISYHSNEIEYFYPESYDKYYALFKKALECWTAKGISYKHEASAILCQIFSLLYRDNKPTYNYDAKIYKSIQYIHENCLKSDFSLTEAAKMSHISEVYFRKLFKKAFGISPKGYVIKRRIQHAEAMINTGYYSLQEISEMCGYNDYKYFSVEFKKITGVSPSKYRYNYNR